MHRMHGRRLAIISVWPSFPVSSGDGLARQMREAMRGASAFVGSKEPGVEPPFARSWAELFDILLDAEPRYAAPSRGRLVSHSPV